MQEAYGKYKNRSISGQGYTDVMLNASEAVTDYNAERGDAINIAGTDQGSVSKEAEHLENDNLT